MKNCILENGIKIIYSQCNNNLTSFCIGFDAGAIREEGFPLGTAHAVEHMIFKGTEDKSEDDINKDLDRLFGFQNAMTNFPYAIYYGSTLNEDFKEGLNLFSSIITSPSFRNHGFKEEIDVILQELKEWDEDPYQATEDFLFFNAFKTRRIKNLIIGEQDSIKNLTLPVIKEFYNTFYVPKNCTIAVVSSLDFSNVVSTIKSCFENWHAVSNITNISPAYLMEKNIAGTYNSPLKDDLCKIQVIYSLDNISNKELKALTLFNHFFGEGVSSFLFNTIRTKEGISYDLGSKIKREKGIELFSIYISTNSSKKSLALEKLLNLIEELKNSSNLFSRENILNASKSIKLKRELFLEKSIQLSKELCTYEIMFGDGNKLYEDVEHLEELTEEDILSVINKFLKAPSICIYG